MQPAVSTLSIGTLLAPISHLVLHPFDQSLRCAEWEQITPTLLPLCWPSHCAPKAPAWCASIPLLKKVSWVPLPGFPHSPTFWQVQNLPGSQPVVALHSQFQVSLGSPKLSASAWIPPAVCSLLSFFPPSLLLRPCLSQHVSGISPPLEGR